MTQRILGHGLRAWLSAHSKLSVECGHGGLRKEVASGLRHNVLTSGFREPDDRDRIPKQGLGLPKTVIQGLQSTACTGCRLKTSRKPRW